MKFKFMRLGKLYSRSDIQINPDGTLVRVYVQSREEVEEESCFREGKSI